MSDYQNQDQYRKPAGPHLLVGLLVIAVGVVILFNRLDIPFFPSWVFSWPMLIVTIGLFIGARTKFQNPGWLILVLLGGFFLLDQMDYFSWELKRMFWPIGIILVGVFLIFRSVITPGQTRRHWSKQDGWSNDSTLDPEEQKKTTMRGEDYIETVNVFGGTKKRIFSKDFKGGQTTNFFGGTDIDLTQADVQGTAVIEIVQVFGGVKLIVPSNWYVKSEIVSVFGGVTDKRVNPTNGDQQKMVVLTGVCIFGGVDIKSY